MKTTLLSRIAFILIPLPTFPQNFVNGSFEVAYDSCRNNISHSTVQNVIPGLYSFGNSSGVDFRANSCPLPGASNPPMAKHGTKYLLFGYDYDNGGGDSLALALTSPLSAGQTYMLSYSHRRQANYTSPVYDIGYSNDSNRFGEKLGFGHCLNFGNVWVDTFYIFTPNTNAKYITLRSPSNGEILYLDNFSLTSVTGINEVADKHLHAYPNPFIDFTVIETGKLVPPFSIQVMDMAGKVYHHEEGITRSEIRIDKDDLPAGVFLLLLRDGNGDIYHSKLVAL